MEYNGKRYCDYCFSEEDESGCKCEWHNEERNVLALPLGTVLQNRYIIGSVIGKGGFGITYICFDNIIGQRMAIKEYMPSDIIRNTDSLTVSSTELKKIQAFKKGIERFLHEAETIRRFNGTPSIVNVTDSFAANGTAYYVMEYLQGITLQSYIEKRGGRLPESEAANIAYHITEGLIRAHDLDVIHRDIAPDNIFVCSDGKIKLIDFGAAKMTFGSETKSSASIVKQGFAPPEQYPSDEEQGPWTDIYALGATVYCMVTGERPPDSTMRWYKDTLQFNAMSSKLAKIASKAMAMHKEDRYKNITEFRKALKTVQQSEIVGIASAGRHTADNETELVSNSPAGSQTGTIITPDNGETMLEVNGQTSARANTASKTPSKTPSRMSAHTAGRYISRRSKKIAIISAISVAAIIALIVGFNLIAAALRTPLGTYEDPEMIRGANGCTHEYGEYETIKERSCEQSGIQQCECKKCGYIHTEIIPELGHTYDEWTITAQPDCETPGSRECVCETCNNKVVEVIPATGHKSGEWQITEKATCTVDGTQTLYCSVCGIALESKTIKAFGAHDFLDWIVTAVPSHYQEGSRYHACKICGEKETETIPIDTTNCISGNCGAEGNDGDNIKWYYYSDTGELVILGSGRGKDYVTDTLPWYARINNIKSVYLSDDITYLGDAWFYDGKFTSIKLPDNLTEIGIYTFRGCEKLTSIIIPDKCTKIGSHAFSYCSISSLIIPKTVTYVGGDAFTGWTNKQVIQINGSTDGWQQNTNGPTHTAYDLGVTKYSSSDYAWDDSCKAKIIYK